MRQITQDGTGGRCVWLEIPAFLGRVRRQQARGNPVMSLQLIPKGDRGTQLLPRNCCLPALLQSHHLGLLVSIESAEGGDADEFQAYDLAI